MDSRRPPFPTMLARAARLRCVWCNRRPGFIRGWFHHYETCQSCGISLRRGDVGFELGAATMNAILTFAMLIGGGAVATIATYPDVPVSGMMIATGIAAVVLPIAFYPLSYMAWFAVELLMDPPGEAAIAAAESQRAVGIAASEEIARKVPDGA